MSGDETLPDLHDWRMNLPSLSKDAHKHRRGRLGVVSGPAYQTGAARLAARAGLRVGAGVVRILCPPDAAPIIAPAIEAVMLGVFHSPAELAEAVEPMNAVVLGPAAGLSEATRKNVEAIAGCGAPVVLDADALTVFQGAPQALFERLRADHVLTPHEGEFERLFPGLLATGREAAAQEAADRAGCVVLLKGPRTVVAAPGGRFGVNDNGTPWLATAGSGDVLAGMIGGLIAQGMESYDAARAAAWMHADAARRFGPGLIAEDLPDLIPAVLADLLES